MLLMIIIIIMNFIHALHTAGAREIQIDQLGFS